MTDKEIGYHAAAIDGEGSINIGKDANNSRDYHPSIHVSNTNKLFLEYLKKTSKIGIIGSTSRDKKHLKYKPYWRWNLRSYEYKEYLLQIKDSLIIKKIQAELMLDFLELYKNEYLGRGAEIPEHIIIQRLTIYLEMQELNKRGI